MTANAAHPAPLETARRMLIVMPSWVGDCVMATPLLRALRGHCRLTEIIGYMPPHLPPLLEPSGLFDRCLAGRPTGLAGPAREAGRLRALGCDTALLLPNSFRSALTVRLAGIPRRLGYDRDHRGRLLSRRVPRPVSGSANQPVPLIDYYIELAAGLGLPRPDDRTPRLAPGAAALAQAQSLLRAHGIADADGFALLNPGASKVGKRWPAAHFAALAQYLHDQHGLRVVINGAPGERALSAAITRSAARAGALDLARFELDLGGLAALCARARIVVTNDTGTRHIAAATGAQRLADGQAAPALVTVFGTVAPAWTTLDHPLETQVVDERGRIDTISLERVIEACRQSLAGAQVDAALSPCHER